MLKSTSHGISALGPHNPSALGLIWIHSGWYAMRYLKADLVCKSLFDIYIWSIFNSRQSTDKQVNITRVSTVSFTGNFPQILLLYHAHTSFLWATWCLICFIPIIKSFLKHWSWLQFVSCLPNLEIELMAGVISQRGCLLLLDTWSHLWYIQRSMLICIS
jgi:hypothetical protein